MFRPTSQGLINSGMLSQYVTRFQPITARDWAFIKPEQLLPVSVLWSQRALTPVLQSCYPWIRYIFTKSHATCPFPRPIRCKDVVHAQTRIIMLSASAFLPPDCINWSRASDTWILRLNEMTRVRTPPSWQSWRPYWFPMLAERAVVCCMSAVYFGLWVMKVERHPCNV